MAGRFSSAMARRLMRAGGRALAVLLVCAAGWYFTREPHRCGCENGVGLCAGELSDGLRNYFLLHAAYNSWKEGLFGSRKFHERKLLDLLYGMIGKEITTEDDFMLDSPEGVVDKTVSSVFQGSRWLIIHGEIDEASFGRALGTDYGRLKGWWRSGVLVAVTGRVKKFRLDWNKYGDTIHLYLDRVTVADDAKAK